VRMTWRQVGRPCVEKEHSASRESMSKMGPQAKILKGSVMKKPSPKSLMIGVARSLGMEIEFANGEFVLPTRRNVRKIGAHSTARKGNRITSRKATGTRINTGEKRR